MRKKTLLARLATAKKRPAARSRSRSARDESEAERVDRLYKSLSQRSKDYLESYVSDRSYKEVQAASRLVPQKDHYAVRVLLEGVTPAYSYREEYEGFDD